jgi:myo-inositol catabolism protein IolC
MNNLGYTQPLFIMACDHRASFAKGIFGVTDENWSPELTETIRDYKYLIYQGLLKAIEQGVPKDHAAILIDELTGDKVLKEAKQTGIATILTVEKSGQDEFTLEYGEDFAAHIVKYGPTFTKALVRYNPDGDLELNGRQRKKLKVLGDYCHQNGLKFLIEPIIPATPQQLAEVAGDKHRYDAELRPDLTIRMITEMQNDGVEVDIWKIEGLEDPISYEEIIAKARQGGGQARQGGGQAREGGRENVSIVVLGRGESDEAVDKWLEAGKKVNGVIGFAIGRTIFMQPLIDLQTQKIGQDEAINQICSNYLGFVKLMGYGQQD